MPFWSKQKRTISKRKPKTLKEVLSDAFRTELGKNPSLMRKVAFKEAGCLDMLDDSNPIAARKQEIKTKIIDRALKKIDEDPDLTEQFVDMQIGEIIGGGRGSGVEVLGEGFGSSISQALQAIEDLEELKGKIGSKSGPLGGLINADTISEILKTIRSLQGHGIPVGLPERTYIVQLDGQMYEVSESQYKRYVQEGRVKPIAELEAPRGEKPEGIVEVAEPVIVEPELPEFLTTLDLEAIARYIDRLPQEFVDQLRLEIQEGSFQSQLLWSFLSENDLDKVVEIITPYRTHSQIGQYIEKLLLNQDWLGEVISLIREELVGG